jgi:PAS domain S-box-containing protein
LRSGRSILGILALLAVGFLAAAITAHMLLADRAWRVAEMRLLHTAQAQVGHFSAWWDARRGDALVLGKDRILAETARDHIAGGDDRLGVLLRERLRGLIEAYPYRSIVLVDAAGKVVMNVGHQGDSVESSLLATAQRAIAQRGTVFSELHVENERDLDIDMAVPLRTTANGPVEAVLSFSIDPGRMISYLSRTLQLLDEGMEVVLGQRAGDKVLLIDSRRIVEQGPSMIVRDVGESNLPAVQAARGARGIVEGIDHRGNRVLAAVQSVPESDWFLLVKQDRASIAAAENRSGAIIAAATLLLSLLALLALRNRLTHIENERLEAEVQVRRRHSDLLRQVDFSARRLEAILGGTPIGLAIVSLDRRLEDVNPAFTQIVGFSREQLLGQSTRLLYPSDDIYRNLGAKADALLRDGGIFEDVATMRRSDGQDIRVRMTARQVRSDPPTTVWACEDVTARLREQKELADARDALQKQTQELARSNAELEQFAYVASHDLRQPLRQVSSYTTLLEKRYAAQLPEEALTFLNFACSGAKRMDRLILDLLEYSRVGRGGRVFEPVPLLVAIQAACDNLAFDIAETGAQVTLPSDAPAVSGDPVELLRLFQNLIGNAVKYRAKDRPCQVAVEIETGEGTVTVRIRDNGIGIDPEYHDRVFGIFQRLHLVDDVEGTGIGLAVCRKIVEHHRGTIELASAEGEGAVFSVTLPLQAET